MKMLLAAVLLSVLSLWAQELNEPARLAPLDEIAIQALGAPEIDSQHFRIDESGSLRLPMAGEIEAAGLTLRELESLIEQGLARYVRNPHALVTVVRYADRPVSILGAVARPGVIQVTRPTTILEILSTVGGTTEEAGSFAALTRRSRWGKPALADVETDSAGNYVARIPLAPLIDGRAPQTNILVQPEDVIAVSRANQVYVIGAVRSPGAFSTKEGDGLSVLQALALAGGLASHASPKRSRVLRQSDLAGDPWQDVEVNLKAMMAGEIPDRRLGQDEILFIPLSGAKATAAQIGRAALSFGTGAAVWSVAR